MNKEDLQESYKIKYAKYYDFFNLSKNYSQECDFLAEIFNKYSNNDVKKILDLGCGTGIHASELSKKGFEVDGLDLSKEMINLAKAKKIQNVNFHIGDMTNFELNKKFDACISMFSSIVYVKENEKLQSIINCARKHLKDHGLLVIDCWNGLGVLTDPPSIRKKEIKQNDLEIIRTSYPSLKAEKHICDINFKIKVLNKGSIIDEYEELHECRFFFPKELEKYLIDGGFDVLEICKSYELGTKADEKIWNMVLIAKANAT